MIESGVKNSATQEVVAELRKREAFVMVSHVKPDGDTLGAGLALGLALKSLGKRVGYFQQDAVPRNLRFLPDTECVARAVPADMPADTLWVFGDMSDFSRAGEYLPEIAHENMLNIDHHLGNSRFAHLNYILEKEASTGTCVLQILRAMNAPITPDIAVRLERAFTNPPADMWLRLQAAYDLRRAKQRLKKTAVRRLWQASTERGRRVA